MTEETIPFGQTELDHAYWMLQDVLRERDSYRAGNTALLEALMDMVYQHCPMDDSIAEIMNHGHLSANENAIRILEEARMTKPTGGGWILDWAALEARKPKRQTWAEAVHECVTDPQEIARLMALDDEVE